MQHACPIYSVILLHSENSFIPRIYIAPLQETYLSDMNQRREYTFENVLLFESVVAVPSCVLP